MTIGAVEIARVHSLEGAAVYIPSSPQLMRHELMSKC